MNESTLRRQERGGINHGGRSDFVLLLSLGRSSFRSSLFGLGRFGTASGLAATTRISGFATASRLSTTATAILLLAAALAEDAVKQTYVATLLATSFPASVFATTSGLSATAWIASGFATASGLSATTWISTSRFAAIVAALLVVDSAEQVQQGVTMALLATASLANITTVVATASRLSATARISRFASGLSATSWISTSRIAAIAAVLLALAAAEEVQQRCSAALGLAGHALHIASSITAAAGSWIRTWCVTTARFIRAAVVVRSEHSVE